MGMCPNCGKKMGFTDGGVKVDGMVVCRNCQPILQERVQKRKEILLRGVDDILAVTSSTLEGYKIKNYVGIVSAQVVMGVDIWKDFLSGIRDSVGGRSRTLQHEFKNAEKIALQELKVDAVLCGGNGIVGLKMDYEIIDTGKGKMVIVVSNGTAVEIEKM